MIDFARRTLKKVQNLKANHSAKALLVGVVFEDRGSFSFLSLTIFRGSSAFSDMFAMDQSSSSFTCSSGSDDVPWVLSSFHHFSQLKHKATTVVMGLGQKFSTLVGSGQFFVAWSGQPFMVWVWIWEISPKIVKFFNLSLRIKTNLFGSGQKVTGSKAGRSLIYCGSKVSSGRVRSHLYTIVIKSSGWCKLL